MITEGSNSADWKSKSALTAPALIGVAAGLVIADSLDPKIRRGIVGSLLLLGATAIAPYVIENVSGLFIGPRSKYGVKKDIQRIRDNGATARNSDAQYDDVDAQLRDQGLI